VGLQQMGQLNALMARQSMQAAGVTTRRAIVAAGTPYAIAIGALAAAPLGYEASLAFAARFQPTTSLLTGLADAASGITLPRAAIGVGATVAGRVGGTALSELEANPNVARTLAPELQSSLPELEGPASYEASSAMQGRLFKADLAAQHIQMADRVGHGLKADATHAMTTFLTREEFKEAVVTPIVGYDGVRRTLVQVSSHGLEGEEGVVEYIIDQSGNITHQRFIAGGVIGAGPNEKLDLGL
jgi:hypothetical protein